MNRLTSGTPIPARQLEKLRTAYYCAVLLDTPGHKYKRGGEGNGCKRCGTLPSHVIHWNSAYWEGERYFYGFS